MNVIAHYLIQYVMKVPMSYGLHYPNLSIVAVAFVVFVASIISGDIYHICHTHQIWQFGHGYSCNCLPLLLSGVIMGTVLIKQLTLSIALCHCPLSSFFLAYVRTNSGKWGIYDVS